MSARIHELRKLLHQEQADAWLSFAAADNQYLSGVRAGAIDFLEQSSIVIVTEDAALYLCDSRYTEQAKAQAMDVSVEQIRGALPANAARRLNELGVRRVVLDPRQVSVADAEALREQLEAEVVLRAGFIAPLRWRKSPEEVETIRRASLLAEDVLDELLLTLGEGDPEQELAARFEYEFKRRGASGASFDTIALFGARSSLPHGEPSDRTLDQGDVVLLDLGCRLDGYCSDLTRTYAFGTMPGTWFTEIYDVTRAAQEAALAAIRPGVACCEVDAIARDRIADAGFGDRFGHGLGHGVGIEVHEAPRLNAESRTVLEVGMVITVEPGIYLPGQGGVRIEDLVVVTEQGCEVLTTAPKDLRVL
jgi:Xaa-Pro aminopeptidase